VTALGDARRIAVGLVSLAIRLGMTADPQGRVTASWRPQTDPLSARASTLQDVRPSDSSVESLQVVASLPRADPPFVQVHGIT